MCFWLFLKMAFFWSHPKRTKIPQKTQCEYFLVKISGQRIYIPIFRHFGQNAALWPFLEKNGHIYFTNNIVVFLIPSIYCFQSLLRTTQLEPKMCMSLLVIQPWWNARYPVLSPILFKYSAGLMGKAKSISFQIHPLMV